MKRTYTCVPDAIHTLQRVECARNERARALLQREAGNPSGLSQEFVHDVKPDQPAVRMSERFRHGGQNGEAERLPQPNCGLVGLHDSVELHRRVPFLRCDFEDVVGQGASDASAGCGGRHHEACVGDMTAGSWLIGMQLGGSYDFTILDRNEYSTAGLAQPPRRAASSLVSVGQQ
jgi:hypothetical protein